MNSSILVSNSKPKCSQKELNTLKTILNGIQTDFSFNFVIFNHNACLYITLCINHVPCVKSVQIRSFGLNTGKYRPEKTPYLNTFHAVVMISCYHFPLKKNLT